MIRLPEIAALSDPRALAAMLGPVNSVESEPMAHIGYSGATHERLTARLANGESRTLVLKRIHTDTDFTAVLSRDRLARETVFASAPRAAVWRAFRSPYLAWARERGEAAVLMEDVSDGLVPDVRRPIERAQEVALLGALAQLHAFYWQRPIVRARWLASEVDLERMLLQFHDATVPLPPFPIMARVREGWALVTGRLQKRVSDVLFASAARCREEMAELPRTLVHGDSKVANFAFRSDGIWAFDWACAASAPPSIDLGWYLAVNASRLSRKKEVVAAHYRALLEESRREPISEPTWAAMWRHAIRYGARTMLWSKAAACERGVEGAETEWAWWADHLPEALGV